jgi:hypothetical protein
MALSDFHTAGEDEPYDYLWAYEAAKLLELRKWLSRARGRAASLEEQWMAACEEVQKAEATLEAAERRLRGEVCQ